VTELSLVSRLTILVSMVLITCVNSLNHGGGANGGEDVECRSEEAFSEIVDITGE
jgi:hypothetical protein